MRDLCRALIFLLLFAAPSAASADGLPYHDNGSLVCEAVILIMSEDQFKEVDSTRIMTLNNDQKRLLHRLFKTVPEKLNIVSSAFNDGLEETSLFDVHAIWLRYNMIAVTYQGNYNEPSEKEFWEKAKFVSVADRRRLVMSSDARVYRDGKELSFADVIHLIDELAKKPRDKAAPEKVAPTPTRYGRVVDDPIASLSFSLPPKNENSPIPDITPETLLEAFRVYGVTRNVRVYRTW